MVSSERVDAIIVFLCYGESIYMFVTFIQSTRRPIATTVGFLISIIVRIEMPPSKSNDEECGRIKKLVRVCCVLWAVAPLGVAYDVVAVYDVYDSVVVDRK